MKAKQDIENIFNHWKDANKFSGLISVSNKKSVIFERTQGFRNKEKQLQNELDTAFNIASGTKLFTAVAICQLIDQGKLTLESRICDILPHDLKMIDKEVSILHLLTHTSGIMDYILTIFLVSKMTSTSTIHFLKITGQV